jgi:hypothetical protein
MDTADLAGDERLAVDRERRDPRLLLITREAAAP